MVNTAEAHANIGVVGLAVMGSNLARNLASREGNTVAVYNRSPERTELLVSEHPEAGFVASKTIEEFAASLSKPRTAIIMVQAGKGTDAVIQQLTEVFEPGDIIVDGGNALFTDTIRREHAVRETGINFVGAGISGGEEGALKGPSIMPGGSAEAWETLGPILKSIAAVAEGEPCVTHVGTDGAGHFVKMIHNGIEYADMQLIAEAYDLIRRGTGKTPAEIAEIFAEWNRGTLESYLIEITAEVLKQVDAKTGQPLIDVILDQAGAKGTGAWTVQTALDLGIPVSGIAEAVFARSLSSKPAQRAAARELAGPSEEWTVADPDQFVEDVRQALYASKIIAYSQGFDEIVAGAEQYGWGHQEGRDREDLARWLHHPCAVPQPHHGGLRGEPRARRPRDGTVLQRRRRRGAGQLASRGRRGRPGRDPLPRVLLVAVVLRRSPRRASARSARAGSARLLRRAHLQARRPRRNLPHAVVGRPQRGRAGGLEPLARRQQTQNARSEFGPGVLCTSWR
jgi:6-phosphogluconate dehydrogenase